MSTELKPLTARFVENLYWIGVVILFIGIAIGMGLAAALCVVGIILMATAAIRLLVQSDF